MGSLLSAGKNDEEKETRIKDPRRQITRVETAEEQGTRRSVLLVTVQQLGLEAAVGAARRALL